MTYSYLETKYVKVKVPCSLFFPRRYTQAAYFLTRMTLNKSTTSEYVHCSRPNQLTTIVVIECPDSACSNLASVTFVSWLYVNALNRNSSDGPRFEVDLGLLR